MKQSLFDALFDIKHNIIGMFCTKELIAKAKTVDNITETKMLQTFNYLFQNQAKELDLPESLDVLTVENQELASNAINQKIHSEVLTLFDYVEYQDTSPLTPFLSSKSHMLIETLKKLEILSSLACYMTADNTVLQILNDVFLEYAQEVNLAQNLNILTVENQELANKAMDVTEIQIITFELNKLFQSAVSAEITCNGLLLAINYANYANNNTLQALNNVFQEQTKGVDVFKGLDLLLKIVA